MLTQHTECSHQTGLNQRQLPIGQETVWAAESVWTRCRRTKYLPMSEIIPRLSCGTSRSLVTELTELHEVMFLTRSTNLIQDLQILF
jgi:hypothetical protein